MEPCRLLVDEPAEGAWNMAVDEALARSVSAADGPTLRCYRWIRPTLSLGYFQAFGNPFLQADGRGYDVVRRSSGGGAILHDHELTYSFVVPRDHRLAAAPEALYRQFHGAFVDALAAVDIAASLREPTSPNDALPEAFLCFERFAGGDLIVGGSKVGGSAQRRVKKAILQHGSLLLESSPHAPQLPGITQLAAVQLSFHQILELWLPHLGEALGICWTQGDLADSEKRRATDIHDTRYAAHAWTCRK